MTGFGVGSANLGGGRVQCEIRALNHRYQDVRVRAPGVFVDHAFFIEQLARQQLGRGRYDLSVRTEGRIDDASSSLSTQRVRAHYAVLSGLRDELAPGTDLPISAVLAMPDVLQAESHDVETVRAALSSAMTAALRAMNEMRDTEGAALLAELNQRLSQLRELRTALSNGAGDLLAHQRERLAKRVERLLADTGVNVDPERLEQEIALLADRSDITEELVRLDSHLAQFDELLASTKPVGRRLDFLLQEMVREVNTIGSKSQHAPVAHLVVEAKAEVERLREQVQNVD